AAHLSLRGHLLDPFAAGLLAEALARQSLLLYGGRLPLRLLRRLGLSAGREPGGSQRQLSCRIVRDPVAAAVRLQAEKLAWLPRKASRPASRPASPASMS